MQPKSPPQQVVVPEVPAAVQEPAASPQESNPAVQDAQSADRQRRLRAAAGNDTLVTGGQGLLDTPTTAKQQLGV